MKPWPIHSETLRKLLLLPLWTKFKNDFFLEIEIGLGAIID